ncbi:MAG: hypothetical protein HOQ24_05720, partial [Mycobacteriaceae bacterium]|nr:hypothetical protein [Mycobacteriaceae bacterium]
MTGFGGGGPWRDRARGSSWRAGAAGVVAGVQQAADSVFDAVDRWTDPRAREVRRRKRLRQRGIRYSVVSTAGSGAAVGLALLSAPMWEVAVVSGGSGIVVFAAARTVQQYRRAR